MVCLVAAPYLAGPMSESPPRTFSRETSRDFARAALLVLAVLVVRLLYLRFLNPWELVGDEAHYWEWSRRIDWSYYTKGPGVAWVIWLSTKLLGTSEFAIRVPSAIASALMALAAAKYAADATGDASRERSTSLSTSASKTNIPLFAAAAVMLAPAYVTLSQLLTTDIFCSAGWLIATWLVFRAIRPGASAATTIASLAVAGFVVGAACLFKYTALLLVPGIMAFFWLERRRIARTRSLFIGLFLSVILFAIAFSPIVIWNITRGWPTVAHQVGRLRLPGGDESVKWDWSPIWFLSFAGAQLAILAVLGATMIGWAY